MLRVWSRGALAAARLGGGLGHVDDLRHGLAVVGWHLAVGVHAGRVGAGVVVHHLVHVHGHVLGGLHGLAGVASWGGHLVAVAAEGGVKIAHVWGLLVDARLGVAGRRHTNTGNVAGVFCRLSQL